MINGSAEAERSVTGSRERHHSSSHQNGNGQDSDITRFLHEVVTDVARSHRGSTAPAAVGVHGCNGHAVPDNGQPEAELSRDLPVWKRALDLTIILLTAPLWLPIMTLIALWVGITSPGPVFYRQPRIGFRGRRFMIVKFRTMKVNAETTTHERYLEQLMVTDCPMIKLDTHGDPRLITGGKILRATGLDELAQIFNVLSGDMSLVGPRPCTVREFELFSPSQCERVNAYPGLTGWWQVNGKNQTTFREMIEMDIFYTRNISLPLDLKIILRTFPAIARQVRDNRQRFARVDSHPSSVQT